MEWSHIPSIEAKVVLLSFSFIWRHSDPANNFFNGHKVLDVINVCCYCCLISLSLLTSFLNNGRSDQCKAAFFLLHLVIYVGGVLFVHTLFLNTWFLVGFLSVPHLVDIFAENADERGRNFLYERTLTSLLVSFYWLEIGNKFKIRFSVFFYVHNFQKKTFFRQAFLCLFN